MKRPAALFRRPAALSRPPRPPGSGCANRARRVVVIAAVALASGCGALERLPAVPAALTEQAVVPNFPRARYWLDRDLAPFIQEILRGRRHQQIARSAMDDREPSGTVSCHLSISGGGDNGAFAAGVLTGWTERGDRPEFTFVTGVSAGALVAPFAFLGPRYDVVLRDVANSLEPGRVFRRRNVLAGLLGDGMADATPLRQLIDRYVTADLLDEIAREYERGRILEIGTTDLDAGRQVVWNMGAIAAARSPAALQLFRDVMLASTSIPGAVPPVMIAVEIDGRRHAEMHADGGVISQLLLFPERTLAELRRAAGRAADRPLRVFVIRNGTLQSEWRDTPRRTLSIARRAIDVLVDSQGLSDVRRIFRMARDESIDFNLAYIGADAGPRPADAFDPAYMRRIFEYGYRLGADGTAWHKTPPGEEITAAP